MLEFIIDVVMNLWKPCNANEYYREKIVRFLFRDLEVEVEDCVWFNVLSRKVIMWFYTTENLSPKYVRPYKIIWSIDTEAYELDMPLELEAVHLLFHVSMW